jgi:hypothetical protein
MVTRWNSIRLNIRLSQAEGLAGPIPGAATHLYSLKGVRSTPLIKYNYKYDGRYVSNGPPDPPIWDFRVCAIWVP